LPSTIFILNQIYKRSQIHDQYGGSRQGGIAVSAKVPFIFIFSGDSGHQHGYKDQWENTDVFSYTGEGQVGDMSFAKGNLAIRDHVKNGRRIFLFTQAARSFVKFEGELELEEFDYFLGPDREGTERLSIKFFLKRAGKRLNYQTQISEVSLLMEPFERTYINTPSITEREGLVTSRVGQGAYRKSILYRWNFSCAVTNYPKIEILVASHIVPWKDANNDERLDVNNGILLSPNYDALFDRHLISFENSGKIILSDAILKSDYVSLGVSGREVISKLSHENHLYLERHRELIII
jgi:5-methylcytosine-specific restriction enzyme A